MNQALLPNPGMQEANSKGQTYLSFGLIGVLSLLVLPLPTFMLDFLLACSISVSLMVLCVSIYLMRPLDFSSYPTVLLLTTLFRLGLNVASTRLILLNGSKGTAAAGHVIETFGQFVVGGNYVVGTIVFLILVIINFKVITGGSGRVAEVAARFTLDAMPGKQMAIDAELTAGHITETEARDRRRGIEREANFYGAMDGASKFVSGDALAGLIITFINIIGGIIIGCFQLDMSFAEAAKTFTILTVGDGLVAQIPALMTSVSAGIIVTRANATSQLSDELSRQLTGDRVAMKVVAVFLFGFALIPGMPTLILLGLSGLTYLWSRRKDPAEKEQLSEPEAQGPAVEGAEALQEMLPMDTLEMELGYALVKMVQDDAEGGLLQRIRAIRKQFALDLGFIVSPVHIRDNLRLEPDVYRLLLRGAEIGRGKLLADRLMAMNPGQVLEQVPGIPGKEPAFGMDALWIDPSDRARAETAGYTVVDCATVVATHLTEIIRHQAPDLLGRAETSELLEVVAKRTPKLVEDLIPSLLTLAEVVRVLKLLLAEEVSIRDMTSILEALSDEAPRTHDAYALAEAVRIRLSRSICQKLADPDGRLHAIFLDPTTEHHLRDHLSPSDRGPMLALDLNQARLLVLNLQNLAATSPMAPLLVTSPDLRRAVSDLLRRFVPQLCVLAHHEVVPRTEVRTIGTLSLMEGKTGAGIGIGFSPVAQGT